MPFGRTRAQRGSKEGQGAQRARGSTCHREARPILEHSQSFHRIRTCYPQSIRPSNRTNFYNKEATSIYYGIMAVAHKMELNLGAKEGINLAVNGCADQLTFGMVRRNLVSAHKQRRKVCLIEANQTIKLRVLCNKLYLQVTLNG